jgi:hypothetical protein
MPDTLKSICEQCTHLNNPQLDFISDARQKEIIFRDTRELVLAASYGLEKTVTILSGCIVESVLFCFLKRNEQYIKDRRGKEFVFPQQIDLQNCVNIFNRWFSAKLPKVDLSDTLVDYPNVAHIDKELVLPANVCGRASREMLVALDTLLGELSQFPIR